MEFKISASITDFPLYTPVETFFKRFKEAGVDGVEIVLGVKTSNIDKLFSLSQQYQLPITSFHQSPWSGFGFSLDENFIRKAKKYGVTIFTFHPLTFTGFSSNRMRDYFKNLAAIQKKYEVTICLENMKNESFYSQLHKSPYEKMEQHLEKLYTIVNQYGFSLTYDTSHTLFAKPQETKIFQKMLPKIRNIHLSSFQNNTEHLPLDKGKFNSRAFLLFLQKQKYNGLLTFEINYSLGKRIFIEYDFPAVERSVKIVKSILPQV